LFSFLSKLVVKFGGSHPRTPKLSPVPNLKKFNQQANKARLRALPALASRLAFAMLTACRKDVQMKKRKRTNDSLQRHSCIDGDE
jgi:hypothetical protein